MKKISIVLLSIVILFSSNCAIYNANAIYSKPEQDINENNYSVVLDKTFDEVWAKLIEYSASTFFSIENYEKASGLITLNFGTSNPSDFVTGGFWKLHRENNYTGDIYNFKGDYVDYLIENNNAKLSGKMNIVVLKITENKTKVIVKARYLFTPDNYWPDQIHSFDTGSCCTYKALNPAPGTEPYRTICPTYKAEEAIINALK